jgi:hypothetical protein
MHLQSLSFHLIPKLEQQLNEIQSSTSICFDKKRSLRGNREIMPIKTEILNPRRVPAGEQ